MPGALPGALPWKVLSRGRFAWLLHGQRTGKGDGVIWYMAMMLSGQLAAWPLMM